LTHLSIDGKIILRRILKKHNAMVRAEFVLCRIGTCESCCEHADGPAHTKLIVRASAWLTELRAERNFQVFQISEGVRR